MYAVSGSSRDVMPTQNLLFACGCLPLVQFLLDCMIHKAPNDFAGLRRLDAATRTWLKELNIDI